MAIPNNITSNHIKLAFQRIDKETENRLLPRIRLSKKYFVHFNGNNYPPKLVISYANKYPNKQELNPNPRNFTTYMAQDYLIARGFKIVALPNAKRKIK